MESKGIGRRVGGGLGVRLAGRRPRSASTRPTGFDIAAFSRGRGGEREQKIEATSVSGTVQRDGRNPKLILEQEVAGQIIDGGDRLQRHTQTIAVVG